MPSYSDINLDNIVPRLLLHIDGIIEMLEGKVAERISNYKPRPIYDTGEFLNKLTHSVERRGDMIVCKIWSEAKDPDGKPYAHFVLGGKVPSWTPIKPLLAWVKRKKLGWDKEEKSGKGKKGNAADLEKRQLGIAYAIRAKIHKQGIKERNVFMEVTREEWEWLQEKIMNYEL